MPTVNWQAIHQGRGKQGSYRKLSVLSRQESHRGDVGAQVWVARSMMKQQAVSTSTLMRLVGEADALVGRTGRAFVLQLGTVATLCVALTGTKVVPSNLTGVMQGLLPCTAVRNGGPRLSAGVLDMDGTLRGTSLRDGRNVTCLASLAPVP